MRLIFLYILLNIIITDRRSVYLAYMYMYDQNVITTLRGPLISVINSQLKVRIFEVSLLPNDFVRLYDFLGSLLRRCWKYLDPIEESFQVTVFEIVSAEVELFVTDDFHQKAMLWHRR